MKTYGHRTCEICGIPVTTSGMGRTAHMRRHAREGRAVGLRWYYADRADCRESVRWHTPESAARLLEREPWIPGTRGGWVKEEL